MVYILYDAKYIIILYRMNKITENFDDIKEKISSKFEDLQNLTQKIPLNYMDYHNLSEKNIDTKFNIISDETVLKINPDAKINMKFAKVKPYILRRFLALSNDIKKRLNNNNRLVKEIADSIEKLNQSGKDILYDYLMEKFGDNEKITDLLNKLLKGQKGGDLKLPEYKQPIKDFIGDLKEYKKHPTNELRSRINKNHIVADKIIDINLYDRFIFIGLTFAIRIIALFFVEWCLNINLINNFYYAMIAYCSFYIILFIFFALLVNVILYYPIFQLYEDYSIVDFPNMFYYMYTYTNGYSRLILHITIITILLIVPFILDINSVEQDIKYDVKKKYYILNNISNFSFIVWILTSLIALKF